MNKQLPERFVERLHEIIPAGDIARVLSTFDEHRSPAFRLNACHPDYQSIKDELRSLADLEWMDWYPDAFVCQTSEGIEGLRHKQDQGLIYQQSLSSMLAAIVLDPQPGQTVLDFCAAPGSKTTLMCALMQNQGRLIALESVRNRFYKLKSVIQLLQADIVEPVFIDARRYRSVDCLFDQILVDAPCSSEGRFHVDRPKSYAYWSVRKIREMRKKQKGLLMNAARCLAPAGRLLYSTCTFAPEENEAVVDWFLRKHENFKILEIRLPAAIETYPCVSEWNNKQWADEVNQSVRICPTTRMDGFFMALFQRTT